MKVQVCTGKMCKSRFSEYILKRLEADKLKFNLQSMMIEPCACLGNCKGGPNVLVDGKLESRCEPAKISKLVIDKLQGKKPEVKAERRSEPRKNYIPRSANTSTVK